MAESGEEYLYICKPFYLQNLGNQEIPIFEYEFKIHVFRNNFIDLWSC